MTEKRIKPSSPFFKEYDDLWTAYAQSKNTHVWWNLKSIPPEFLMNFQDEVEEKMNKLLDEE